MAYNQGNQYGRGQQNRSSGNRQQESWGKGFIFFEGDQVKLQWVSEYANDFAKLLAANKLSGTQLRAFYNEFLRIRDIPADSLQKNVMVKLLAAKITYRKTATARDIPDDLVSFITEIVNQIGTSETKFKQACYIMEAIVGFFPKK